MEIVEANSKLLTDYEVYKVLSEIRQSHKKFTEKSRGLSTVVYEALQYFDSTSACPACADQNFVDFLANVKHLKLTKAETLQILNLRPINAVEIQLIVEECEERLSEEQVDELIALVEQTLPIKNEKQPENNVPIDSANETVS